MKLTNPSARIFIPDGKPVEEAVTRITHLGIGAHQDDLEFMAFHGIVECFYSQEKWFGGITCSDGAGSSRIGKYASFTDVQMKNIRVIEQEKAATIGNYAAMFQLDYPSSRMKDPKETAVVNDLVAIMTAAQPEVIYTHNPADKHDTHIATLVSVIKAVRALPKEKRPKKIYGCEVWRNLDWMNDSEKVVHDVTGCDNLAATLNGVFDSQIAGGKRYDLATMGRRRANATFFEAHASDKADQILFAIDLSPLAQDDSIDLVEYTCGFIKRFETDVRSRLGKLMGR